MIFVPPPFAADSILEATDAGIATIIAITEGIPAHDELRVYTELRRAGGARLIGPNCPGVLSPGKGKRRDHPRRLLPRRKRRRRLALRHPHLPGRQRAGPARPRQFVDRRDRRRPRAGSSFVDIIALFEADPETELIVMSGEIGGQGEEEAADYIAANVRSRSSHTSPASPLHPARRWATPAQSSPEPTEPQRRRRRRSRRTAFASGAHRQSGGHRRLHVG